jgi:DNA replication protein DnaD
MATINYYYTKSVLETVSENPLKFKKELRQAKENLLPFEIEHLTKWLISFTTNKPELKQCIKDAKINKAY